MPSKIKIQIAEPCHEKWNDMTAAEQGRFCQSCQKTVADFTMMSDKEILQFLAISNADICGRASVNQLDRYLQVPKNRRVWTYGFNLAVAGLLSVTQLSAQSTSEVSRGSVEKVKVFSDGEIAVDMVLPKKLKVIKGVVVDSKTNLPVPFASVRVKGTSSSVASDANGHFSINIMFEKDTVILEVSIIGYNVEEYMVTASSSDVKFYLEPAAEIRSSSADSLLLEQPGTPVMMGMIIQVKEVPVTEKVKRKVDVFIPELAKSKTIKVYPNPVATGSDAGVGLSLKEKGRYTLELLSTDGKLMHSQKLSGAEKEQQVIIPTSRKWSAGTYWLRLTKENSAKVEQAKLIIR